MYVCMYVGTVCMYVHVCYNLFFELEICSVHNFKCQREVQILTNGTPLLYSTVYSYVCMCVCMNVFLYLYTVCMYIVMCVYMSFPEVVVVINIT